jgi:hypothetical protein
LLFVPVLLAPGYVTGYLLDLFDFRKRQIAVRFGLGLILSCVISPILFFLTYRIGADFLAVIVQLGLVAAFVLILFRERDLGTFFNSLTNNRFAKVILLTATLWTIAATFSLIDIQWGDRLYFNIVSYDYSTRVAVINAITRSGVPPVNPSYYPGEPVKLTFLYYFWYVLCSLVDQLGGQIVDSRAALIASVIWTGLALISLTALYIRIRNTAPQPAVWRVALVGIGLLAVSGLDILGSTFYIMFPQYLLGHVIIGDIEHWNEQITAWVGTTLWTPHHLVSLLTGILGWILTIYHQNRPSFQKMGAAVIAGLAFASAFGLSSWVTLIFVFFWMIWLLIRLLHGELLRDLWSLLVPGIVAAIAILPFVMDLTAGSSSSAAANPLILDVREFRPANILTFDMPGWERALVNLILLPVNYFLELGFFLVAGMYWYHHFGRGHLKEHPFLQGEFILLLVSAVLATFSRSTLISNNDFGWRGWLPGQFILLVWGADTISHVWSKLPGLQVDLFRTRLSVRSMRILLAVLAAIGLSTSLQDVLLLRTWPMLVDADLVHSPHPELFDGKRIYEARTVYNLIDTRTPLDEIIQSNPGFSVDRPGGLYRTRNSVIATHTLYGVTPEQYEPLLQEVRNIFETKTSNWQRLDVACQRYAIDLLVITDADLLWKSREILQSERQPLFSGRYYTVFSCG